MPHLQFDMDLLAALPNISRASGVSAEQLAHGLLQMWAYCWRERIDTLNAVHIAGFFGGEPEKVCEAFGAFGVIEKNDDGFRVRGAARYLRILEAQRKAAEQTNLRWTDGRPTGLATVDRESVGGASVERRSTGRSTERSPVGPLPLPPPAPPSSLIDHRSSIGRNPSASPQGSPPKADRRGSERAKHIAHDTPPEGLDSVDQCRRAWAKLWRDEHGGNGAAYPDQPGEDRQHVGDVINYHRRNKLTYNWQSWVWSVFKHYIAIKDDRLIVSSNHALRHLPGALPRLVPVVAAELDAQAAEDPPHDG